MCAMHTLKGFRDPLMLAELPAGTPMAVALSGGADSVALLSLLRDRENLSAIHVHHGIRGAEADRDAAFCRELASSLHIPFYLLHIDAPAVAKQTGESLETAARAARYAAMTALMCEKGIPLLLTAHHADDQLETMLQHLLRGSGTRGLCGIPACRPLGDGLLVARPLLSVPKAELLDYLTSENLSFVTDSTNEEPCCQRNFLRLRVLPLLRELQPNAPALAARCAEALAGDEQYLDGLAAEFLAREGAHPHKDALLALPQPIFVRVMRRLLPEPPSALHLASIRTLLSSEKPHASLSLPPHTVLALHRGKLTVTRKAAGTSYTMQLYRSEADLKTEPLPDAVVLACPLSPKTEQRLAASYTYRATAKIRQADIAGELFLRARRAGDVILAGGMHKAVRRLAALSELTPATRASMPLLCDEHGIVAVPLGPVRDSARSDPDLTVYFYFN